MSATVRWGILGTARIATKVTLAIQGAADAEVAAIASRSHERAREWASERGVPQGYGSYEDLLADETIDAVYIPLPPSMHAEWTIRAAERGKHVLCEKPLARSAAEGEAMAAACRQYGVQLMDGTMWLHHPRAVDMSRPLRDGSLGDLRRVTAGFGFVIESYLQNKPPYMARRRAGAGEGGGSLGSVRPFELRFQRELGGGALLDLGWYCVGATLWAFGSLPTRVFGAARYENDVDMNFSALMWFGEDRMASFDCGFDMSWRKWFEIVGTEGSLVCDDFVNPWKEPPRCWLHNSEGKATELVSESAVQEQCMIEAFCDAIRSGALVDAWPSVALMTQRVCDALDNSARTGAVVDLI